jgi:hypothetical protein
MQFRATGGGPATRSAVLAGGRLVLAMILVAAALGWTLIVRQARIIGPALRSGCSGPEVKLAGASGVLRASKWRCNSCGSPSCKCIPIPHDASGRLRSWLPIRRQLRSIWRAKSRRRSSRTRTALFAGRRQRAGHPCCHGSCMPRRASPSVTLEGRRRRAVLP